MERWRHAALGNGLHPITDFTEHLKEPRPGSDTLNIQHASASVQLPLTFLETVPEGARPAHGASLLVQRHARVPQPVVAAGVEGGVLIGQAVVAQTGEVDLSC